MTRADFYLLSFKSSKGDEEIDSLVWINDPVVPEGEVFRMPGVEEHKERAAESIVEGAT